MRSIRGRGIGVLVAVALAALAAAAPAPGASPREPLSHHGRWTTDAAGRVVVLHGAAVVPDGITKPFETAEEAGFAKVDAEFLAGHGFNVVRLGAFYGAYERQPGVFSEEYMDSFARTQRLLADAGIFTVFDFHQDMLNPRYQGRGFADWFIRDDGLPNQPMAGFPGNYFLNGALNRAYDNLWANVAAADGVGVQDHFAEGWRRVAARFAGTSHIAGYDLLNEPWPGSAWPACASTEGCPPGGFDETQLTAFHNRVIAGIRKADRRHLVYYEPNLQFDVGAKTTHGKVDDPNVGFSFHNYCLGAAPGLPHAPDPAELCKDLGERRVFQNAEDHSQKTGATLLMTEFGDVQDPTIHARVTELADDFMVGWTVWGWFRAAGQIKQDPAKPPTPENLNQDVLAAVVRPYPRVVAGTPESYGYDPETKRFQARFSTRLPDGRTAGDMLSEVFVPRLHYGRDYRVTLSGAELVRGLGTQVPELRACPGASSVSISITDQPPAPTLTCPRRCLARRSPIGPRNVGRVRLGYTRKRALRRIAPQPVSQRGFVYRWCVRGAVGRVTAVFSSRKRKGRVRLVTTTSPRHRSRTVGRGAGVGRLARRFPKSRRLAPGLFRAGPRSPRVFGTRRGKVRFVAVADRRLLRKPRVLRRYVRRAGLG